MPTPAATPPAASTPSARRSPPHAREIPAPLQLLELGANCHCAGSTKDVPPPLTAAVTAGNNGAIELLLEAGASPFLEHCGATALDEATRVRSRRGPACPPPPPATP